MDSLDIKSEALKFAFDSVKLNHGCAGVDGVTIEAFESNLDVNLNRLKAELINKKYRPMLGW